MVDGQFLHLIVVESDAQVGGEVEFARHVPHDTLEECVDGFHAEVVVVVQQVGEADACPFADDTGVEAGILLHFLQVVVRVGQLFPDAVELAKNAHLHLLGGLVGEGNGEDAAVTHRVLYQQRDVFGGEREGLSAAGTCFIYVEWCYHRLNSSKSNFTPNSSNLVLRKLAKAPAEM